MSVFVISPDVSISRGPSQSAHKHPCWAGYQHCFPWPVPSNRDDQGPAWRFKQGFLGRSCAGCRRACQRAPSSPCSPVGVGEAASGAGLVCPPLVPAVRGPGAVRASAPHTYCAPSSSEMAVGFFGPFWYLLVRILPQLCVHMIILVPYSFLVCCSSGAVSWHKLCSKGSKVPGPPQG